MCRTDRTASAINSCTRSGFATPTFVPGAEYIAKAILVRTVSAINSLLPDKICSVIEGPSCPKISLSRPPSAPRRDAKRGLVAMMLAINASRRGSGGGGASAAMNESIWRSISSELTKKEPITRNYGLRSPTACSKRLMALACSASAQGGELGL